MADAPSTVLERQELPPLQEVVVPIPDAIPAEETKGAAFNIAEVSDFAEIGIRVNPAVDAGIEEVNRIYRTLGRDRFHTDVLAPLEHHKTADGKREPLLEYGDPDWKTALVYTTPFESGADRTINIRALTLFVTLNEVLGIRDQDGNPLRVVTFPAPTRGKNKSVQLPRTPREIIDMALHYDPKAYTENQIKTLEERGVERIFADGFSFGGLASLLLADHALSEDRLEVLGVVSSNGPGMGRHTRTMPGANVDILRRLIRSGGNTVKQVIDSGHHALIDAIPDWRNVDPSLETGIDQLKDKTLMTLHTMGRLANLGLWGIMANPTGVGPAERLAERGVLTDYTLSTGDFVSYPKLWIPRLREIKAVGGEAVRVTALAGTHDIGSNPRLLNTIITQNAQDTLALAA